MNPLIQIIQRLLELHHRKHLFWYPQSDLSSSFPDFCDILGNITGIPSQDIRKIAAKVKIRDSIDVLRNELPLAKEVIAELDGFYGNGHDQQGGYCS